jgi:hypothetical protein
MAATPEKINVLFRAAAVLAAVFAVTVLALVVSAAGGGGSPVAKFLNEHSGEIIAVEVAATLFCALGAMTIDRWRTLRNEKTRSAPSVEDQANDLDSE